MVQAKNSKKVIKKPPNETKEVTEFVTKYGFANIISCLYDLAKKEIKFVTDNDDHLWVDNEFERGSGTGAIPESLEFILGVCRKSEFDINQGKWVQNFSDKLEATEKKRFEKSRAADLAEYNRLKVKLGK